MTKEEAIKRLKEQQDNEDYESAHAIADDTLCDFLTALGYADVVAEYEEVGKWYS